MLSLSFLDDFSIQIGGGVPSLWAKNYGKPKEHIALKAKLGATAKTLRVFKGADEEVGTVLSILLLPETHKI